MNVIDIESVDEHLRALRDYVHQLYPYQEWTPEALLDQPIVYNGVLHLIQIYKFLEREGYLGGGRTNND